MGGQLERRDAQPDRRRRAATWSTRSRSARARPTSLPAPVRCGSATRPVIACSASTRTAIRSPRRSTSVPGRRRSPRLRVGVGREQPGRDGLADRPANELRHRDGRGRRRRRRHRGRRGRGVGHKPVRRDAVADQPRGQRRRRGRSRSATAPRVSRSQTARCGWASGRPTPSHRGGTLSVLTTGHVDTVDPLLTQNLYAILPLTYDGLTAYQRVGGSGSVQLVPDLAVSLPSANRRRHHLHLPAAARDPLLERRAAPPGGLPPRARARPDPRREHQLRQPVRGRHRRRRLRGPPEPLRSLPRRRHRRRGRHRHLSPGRAEPRVPRPAHAPRRLPGATGHTQSRHRASPDARHGCLRVGRRLP